MIEEKFDYLSYLRTPERYPYIFAAAGLARAVALLRAMCVVAVARRDTLGTLTRPLYEAWLVALYCDYGGEDALRRLKSGQRRSLRIIDEARKLGLGRNLASWTVPEEKFVLASVLSFVDQHLLVDAIGDGEDGFEERRRTRPSRLPLSCTDPNP